MDIEDRAYASGMEQAFVRSGFSKKASHDVSEAITELTKKASLFNFSDSPYGGGGISLSSILVPLLAAGGAGFIAYNAGQQGSPDKSAFTNIKNYLGSNLSKLFRRDTVPALTHFTKLPNY